jgi:hypothetical protein
MTERGAVVQKSALNILLGIHKFVLGGLLVLAVLIGFFPVIVVCDDGKIMRCAMTGVLFFCAVSDPSLLTVGLAILALMWPGRRSQIYLMVYSLFLMGSVFYFPSWTNFRWLKEGLAALGWLTCFCVLFLDAGRNLPFKNKPG